jgi:hypothetical protein
MSSFFSNWICDLLEYPYAANLTHKLAAAQDQITGLQARLAMGSVGGALKNYGGRAPLAYEHANAFAFRGHNIHSLYKWRSSVSDQSETKLTVRTMALTWRYGRNGEIA